MIPMEKSIVMIIDIIFFSRDVFNISQNLDFIFP